MTMIQCISPVDGSVYAEREAMSLEAAQAVVDRVRKAQKAWARRPLEERVQLVLKGVARLNEMADEIVPEPYVEKLVGKLRTQRGISIDYRVVDGANHFFKDETEILMSHVHDHLNKAGGGREIQTLLPKAA